MKLSGRTLWPTVGSALLLGATLAVTWLRAIRWPNDFAEAHWLIDYSSGFGKRALAGQLLSLVTGGQPTETAIRVLSAAIAVLFGAALLLVMLRVIARSGTTRTATLAMAAFASSPFIVMNAHLIGYLDQVIVLLGCASIVCLLRRSTWWAFGLQAIAVLVHENAAVVTVPVAAFGWLMTGQARQTSLGGTWLARSLPLSLPIAALVALVLAGSVTPPGERDDRLASRLERFEFVRGDMHVLVPQWLAGSLDRQATGQIHRFAERATNAELHGLMLPSVLSLVVFALGAFAMRGRLAFFALAGAIAAPMLLHMAAWDTVRIWTFSIGTAFLCTWVVAERAPRQQGESAAAMAAALVTLLVNVVSSTPLYDRLADWYSLKDRLWMYAPILVACGWIAWTAKAEPATRPASPSQQ